MQPIVEFSTGSVLERGLGISGRNFFGFTFLSALIFLPAVVWLVLLMEGVLPYSQASVIVMSLLTGMLGSVVSLVLFHATWNALRGQPASALASLSAVRSRVLPALGVAIMSVLAVTAAMLAGCWKSGRVLKKVEMQGGES